MSEQNSHSTRLTNSYLVFSIYKYFHLNKQQQFTHIKNQELQILIKLHQTTPTNELLVLSFSNSISYFNIDCFLSKLKLETKEKDSRFSTSEVNFRKNHNMNLFINSKKALGKGKLVKHILITNYHQYVAVYFKKDNFIKFINYEAKVVSQLKVDKVSAMCEINDTLIAVHSNSNSKTLKLIDSRKKIIVKEINVPNEIIYKAMLSLDRETLLAGNQDGKLCVYNTVSGSLIFNLTEIYSSQVRKLLVFGQTVIVGFINGTISLCEINKNELIKRKNERGLLSKESIYIKDELTIKHIESFKYHSNKITEIIKVNSDSKTQQQMFASSCKQGLINLWTRNEKIYSFITHEAKVYSLIFNEKYNLLLSSNEKHIKFFNLETKEEIYHINNDKFSKQTDNLRLIFINK